MKICLIADTYTPYFDGGAGIYTETIANEMLKAGHCVSVITTRPFDGRCSLFFQEEKVSPRYSIFRLYPLNIYLKMNYAKHNILVKPLWYMLDVWNPHVYLSFLKLTQKHQWDIVHTHNLYGFSSSILSAIKKRRLPWIHTLHDYAFLCPRATLYRSSNELCLNPPWPCKLFLTAKKLFWLTPDLVISPSKFLLDFFGEQRFFKGSEKVVLPLGVPVNTERLASLHKHRKEKVFSERGLKLLFLGRIEEYKGIRWLLKTLTENHIPEVELHIAGVGTQEKLLRKSYAGDKVIFHGYVYNETKNALLESCDILVMPSLWYENSPVAIYEAFSYGMPVLGSKIGGIPELVKEGETGFNFEPENDSQLISLLKKLVSDKGLLLAMSQRCLDFYSELDIKNHMQRLQAYYQDCISSRNK